MKQPLLTFASLFLPVLAMFSVPITIASSVWWWILRITSPIKKELARRKKALKTARSLLTTANEKFIRALKRHNHEFEAKKSQLAEAKLQYTNLKSLRSAEYDSLQSHARERQLDDYLERCFLSSSKINGIGPSRIVTLESYGIETAADITFERVASLPGFGNKLTARVVAWRDQKIASFRFDPSKGAPQSAIQTLDNKYLQIRSQLQQRLEEGSKGLRRQLNSANAELGRMDEEIWQLELAVEQAELDVRVARI